VEGVLVGRRGLLASTFALGTTIKTKTPVSKSCEDDKMSLIFIAAPNEN
jgi:hypothetical protein